MASAAAIFSTPLAGHRTQHVKRPRRRSQEPHLATRPCPLPRPSSPPRRVRYVPPRSYFGFSRASPSPTPPTARPRRALPSCSILPANSTHPVVASLNLRSAAPPRGVSPRPPRVPRRVRPPRRRLRALRAHRVRARHPRRSRRDGERQDGGRLGTPRGLRHVPAGDLVNLGEAMGPGKAILVMLRHLG